MKHITYQDLCICVETDQGTERHWYDPFSDTKGTTYMQNPYGFICGTLGTDGEEVDVYVGPSPHAENVFVVTQLKAPEFVEIDEQKVMLGFDSEQEAKAAYLKHYNNPKFLGSIKQYTMLAFKAKLQASNGKLIKHLFLNERSASIQGPSSRTGVNMSTPKEILKALTSRLMSTKSGKAISVATDTVSSGEEQITVEPIAAAKEPHLYEAFRNGRPVVNVSAAPEQVNVQIYKSCNACGHMNKSLDNSCSHCSLLEKQSAPALPIWRR